MRRLVFTSIAGVALLTTTMSAGAPPGAISSGITLNVPARAGSAASGASSDGTIWPAIGATVSFASAFPESVAEYNPRIQVMCYQEGVVTYGEAGPYNQSFLLGGSGSTWLYETSNLPAHCVADLYYWSYQDSQQFNWLASTEFDAGGRQQRDARRLE